MTWRMVLATFGLLVLCSTNGLTQDSSEDLARKILTLNGAGDIGAELVDSLIAVFESQSGDDISEKFWAEFKKEIDPNSIVELFVPVYVKHFTNEEMTGLLEFYETPVGQKWLEKQPIILQESKEAGEKWAKKLAFRALQKMIEAED